VGVRDSGTYLSRRARLSPPRGKLWAPYEKYASHWITYHSLVPCRKWGVEIKKTEVNTFVCFDHVTPVAEVRKDFSDTENYQLIHEGDNIYQDFSFLVQEDQRSTPPRLKLAWAWQFPDGSYCHPHDLSRTGIMHVPRGSSIIFDSQIHSNVFHTPRGKFMDVSSSPPGIVFLLPRASDLKRVCAMASIYNHPLPVQYPQILGAKENSITEQIGYNKLSFRLRSFLGTHVVRSLSDTAYTVAQLARELGVPMAAVLYHLNKTSDYYCWRADGPILSSFALVESMQIFFPGELREGCIDGCSWSKVLQGLHSGENVLKSVDRRYAEFVALLERNGIGVSIQKEAAYDVLTCYKGVRY